MAFALKRQNMRRDPIEEPTIVADHNSAAGKFLKRFFQRPQRIHIKVICWLIEQQQIRPTFQHPRQMHPVALTTRKLAHLFLLVATAEIKLTNISA